MDKMALSATLHCLTGCSIGEVLGMMIGAHFGLDNILTVVISVILAFLFGYIFSLIPLVRGGISVGSAAKLVLLADTLSITVMEIVDNAVMLTVPGAMDASLFSWHFWLSMALALFAAFWAAYPVNKYLLSRGKGHALVHKHMSHHGNDHDHSHHH